ncbi:Isopenicillin N epimerase component 1 [Lecanosticta acicola]|uniref:Very long-chain fatty acid transport protein n=1 Tax=Lecanosticta acicola TaxID=111012 RepID=A0AAI8Z4M3_9PEZI|nr:Isopenicillin N epimerase component 1 [Lecanosticta acicola]
MALPNALQHVSSMALASAAAVGGLAAVYLDGKYQLRQELDVIRRLKRAERAYAKAAQQDRLSPWYLVADTCRRQPHARAIWTRERQYTFREFHDQTVRYAQWMLAQGIKPGDLVALYLHNSADFLMLFFATHCIGAAPALINYNLEGNALMHCLDVADSKLLIIDPDSGCQQRIDGSRQEIESAGATIFTLDAALKQSITSLAPTVPQDSYRAGMKGDSSYALIYTSGTTGLPKGCPFQVNRIWLAGPQLEPLYGTVQGKDCWYDPMPFYHGTGLGISTVALISGVAVAIAPRFSVSNFWPDIHDSKATCFVYVGETVRYLLAAPPHPLERKHNLRIAYGNGLRPDVWSRLQERFNIPEVVEFFNSSEGVFTLGVQARGPYLSHCVGHHGLIFRTLLRNTYIPVRTDAETGDIWRDPKTGFAMRLPYEEGGEILVGIPNKEAFGGYWRNPEATEKKFATDVFKKGDLYYRSGDALRRSNDGHWYFLDRLGDTFRWKSENVSTAEVAQVLGHFPGITEANVYGVSLPNHEGRAGCAALNLSHPINYTDLLAHCRKELPKYAVPVFLRIVERSSHTHNSKQNKVGLRKEGVDFDLLGKFEKGGEADVLLWLKDGRYAEYERGDWESIKGGRARL